MADLRLRREVIVPPAGATRPRLLVALSVALVLVAGALDAFLWKQARTQAVGPPQRTIRVAVDERLDRLELKQRLDRLGRGRGSRGEPTHPSQVIGSPPY